MQGSSSTPPRIPADIRREAIAAAATATTSSKRSARSNRIRRATSSLQRSSGPIRSLWGRSYSSHDDGIRNPNLSRTALRRSISSVEQYANSPLYGTPKHQNATPPSSPPNPLSPYHQHTAASAAAASAAAVRAMANTASSDLAVAVAPVTNNRRSGGRGRSCPPITRRIHPPPMLSPPCEETPYQRGDVRNQEQQRPCSTTTTVMADRRQTLDDEMYNSNLKGNTDVGVHAPLGILSRCASTCERSVDTAYIPEDDEADEATSSMRAGAGVGSGSRNGPSGYETSSTVRVLARDSSERLAKDVKLRFERLRKISENRKCVDCGGPCADWASVCHGAFVCLNCAGHHRALGLHVAFTRSLTMDRWTEESVRRMELGGNKRLLEFVRRAGLSVSPLATVNDKYMHPWLALYRKYIAALGNGKEPPSLSREALDEALLDTGTLFDGDGEDGSVSPFTRFARSVSSCGGISSALVKCSWTGGGFHVASGVVSRGRSGTGGAPKWVPDHEAKACMLCRSRFTIILRRHHCRRCGRVACAFCAPAKNTRPIVEWGLTQAVRHCHQCYRSPLLDWTNLPQPVTDGAYECSGNNQPS